MIEEARQLDDQARGLVKEAAKKIEEAELLRRTAAEQQRLTGPQPLSKLNKAVTDSQRASMSTKLGGDTDWMTAARKAKPPLPSQIAVAKALGVKPAFISQIKHGTSKMPPDLAERFEKLTGYPRTKWRR
jgi:hypothetical protein